MLQQRRVETMNCVFIHEMHIDFPDVGEVMEA